MFIGDAHHRRDAQAVGVRGVEAGHGCSTACCAALLLHAVAGLPALGSASRRASDTPSPPQPALRARGGAYWANDAPAKSSTKLGLSVMGELSARLVQDAALKGIDQSKRVQT